MTFPINQIPPGMPRVDAWLSSKINQIIYAINIMRPIPSPSVRVSMTTNGTIYEAIGQASVAPVGISLCKIFEIENDYIACRTVLDRDGATDDSGPPLKVARPIYLRKGAPSSDGWIYTYSTDSQVRDSKMEDEPKAMFTERINPLYKPDDYLLVADVGTVFTHLENVKLIDLNIDARRWEKDLKETAVCVDGVTKYTMVLRSTVYDK